MFSGVMHTDTSNQYHTYSIVSYLRTQNLKIRFLRQKMKILFPHSTIAAGLSIFSLNPTDMNITQSTSSLINIKDSKTENSKETSEIIFSDHLLYWTTAISGHRYSARVLAGTQTGIDSQSTTLPLLLKHISLYNII